MMNIETSLTIISIVLTIWIILGIYILLQAWQVLKRLNKILVTINSCLPGIIANIGETAIRINTTTKNATLKIESLLIGVSALKSMLSAGRSKHQQGLLGTVLAVVGNLATIKAIWKGLGAFISAFRTKK